MIEIDQKDCREALDRIARTPDGLLLYRYLQRICLGITPASAPKRALPVNEGRRTFAAELMAHMAEGIGDNDRSCITYSIGKRASGTGDSDAGRRGTRRVSLDADDANPIDAFIAEYNAPKPGNGAS